MRRFLILSLAAMLTWTATAPDADACGRFRGRLRGLLGRVFHGHGHSSSGGCSVCR